MSDSSSESDEDAEFEALLREVARAPKINLDTSQTAIDTKEGQQFGRYQLISRLARGGMASVYLAHMETHPGVVRKVAIKLIHPHLTDDERFVRMFLDEAFVASRIVHTNVCQLLDFGMQDETPYLVMEYLPGESLLTLGKRVRRGTDKLPMWLVSRIVADAARGLHAAHEVRDDKGNPLEIVHRDVGPSNIMVLYDGISKVLDFGIARARGRLSTTEQDQLKGKLPYMSPEQLTTKKVTRQTDVWALGVTLWEGTVGRPLFRGENEGETALNIAHGKVTRPSEVVENFPPMLEATIMGALDRDVTVRTKTAADLATSLEEYLYSVGRPAGQAQVAQWMDENFAERKAERERMERSEPIRSVPPPPPEPINSGLLTSVSVDPRAYERPPETPLPPRRSAKGALPLLGVALIVFAGGAYAVWPHSPPPPAARTAAPAQTTPSEQPTQPSTKVLAAQTDVPPVAPTPVEPAEPTEVAEPTETRNPNPNTRGTRHSAPRQTGTIDLLVIPSSRVLLKNRPLGQTPLLNYTLPAGRHSLVLEAANGHTKRVQVEIRPGERSRYTFNLR